METKLHGMKITEILKYVGLFSEDINQKFKNNQIILNGEIVNEDIDLNVSEIIDAGEWLSKYICSMSLTPLRTFKILCHIAEIDNIFADGCCTFNDIPIHTVYPELNEYLFLRISKKQSYVLKKITI